MAKTKKTGKSRAVSVSPALRVIQKMHSAIAADQEKLVRRYEKTIRTAEKDTARLAAKLEKARKIKTQPKPGRGRKPAQNALQMLQNACQQAQSELEQLTLGMKKMLAERKALAVFEKEWKKSAKELKATKTAKAPETKKTVKASVTKNAKSKKPAGAARKSGKSSAAISRSSAKEQPELVDSVRTDLSEVEMA